MATGKKSAVARYGFSVGAFVMTLIVALIFNHFSISLNLSLLVVAALIFAAWYGGRGPGFLVAVLFELTSVTNLYNFKIHHWRFRDPDFHMWRFIFGDVNTMTLFTVLILLVYARKQAEKGLREQREWLRVTLSSIGDAVIATDLNGIITFLNPTAELLTGWPSASAEKKPLGEVFNIVDEVTRQRPDNPVSKVIREKATIALGNHTVLVSKDGSERLIDDSGAPIRDQHGRITGVVLVFRDVTERIHAEEERERLHQREHEARENAEAANRLKDEFLATVSHELRTPLTAMLGWSKMLKRGNLDNDTIHRAIEIIDRNATAQSRIVNDILDMSRIISGKMRLEFHPVEITKVIETTIENLRPAADAKGLTLRENLPSASVQINGDADRLQQVMWNLLSNAIRFTPQGGHIEINLKSDDSNVEISVVDSGIGISKEFLPHVFDRFRQADSSITRKYGGLGLGLAVVRNLVELHGGTVSADSAGDGQGATFTVKLPAGLQREGKDQEQQTVAAAADNRPPFVDSVITRQVDWNHRPNLGGLRVLVVDDEADALDLISVVLKQYGAEVQTAMSTPEALETLSQWRPNVLVSDIGMPGEDGYVLIRKVRSLAPDQGGKTPAAALTAYARLEDRLKVLAAGYQMHVPKPVDPQEIATVVSSLASQN